MNALRYFCFAIVASLALTSPAHAEYMTLEQAMALAYNNNPSLEAERAKLRATDEQVSLALSHWRPSLEATSSISKAYQRIPGQEAYGTANYAANTTSYGAQITQPIFRGFRTLLETEAAKNRSKPVAPNCRLRKKNSFLIRPRPFSMWFVTNISSAPTMTMKLS